MGTLSASTHGRRKNRRASQIRGTAAKTLFRPLTILISPSRMAAKSPTQRSLEYLREQGYHCEVVEKWNQLDQTEEPTCGHGATS
jgi:hypothetical protein